jgi:hypothetical protein
MTGSAPGPVLHCNFGTAANEPTSVTAHGGARWPAAEIGNVTALTAAVRGDKKTA